jgi:hypothetical protein
VVVGIAASAAMLVGVFGGSVIATELALWQAIDELPPADRSFRVDVIGLPSEVGSTTSERSARDALAQLSPDKPLGVTFFREFWLDGQFVRLAALDEPDRFVHVVSGRLPRSCRPEACEVLQIGNRGGPALHEGGINLVRVGIGELRDVAGLGPAFQRLRQERAQESVVEAVPLLAPSVSALEHYPALRLLFRVRSWVVPLASSGVRAWDIERTLSRESRAQAILQRGGSTYVLAGPDAALLEARDRGAVYGERMILIGGTAAALLLGFAMVAAIGLRRGIAAERHRLLRRGSSRTQVWIALFTEVGAITVAGWIVGVVVGGLVIGVLAAMLDFPAAGTLGHSLLELRAIGALLLAWVLAAAVIVGVVATEGDQPHGKRIRLLDIAALGVALAVAVGVTRGALSADARESSGDRTLLLVLPGLVCFVAAVAAARALGPVMRLAERLSRRGMLAVRLAFLALARAPSRTATAGAFLVIAVGLILFASSYHSTLERAHPTGRIHRAAGRRFPKVRGSSRRSKLLRSIAGHLAPGSPRTRLSGGRPGSSASGRRCNYHRRRRTLRALAARLAPISSVPQAALAHGLLKDASLRLRGPEIPPDAETVQVRAHVEGTPLRIDVVIRDASNRIEIIPLGKATSGSSVLAARLPRERPGARPRRVIGLQLSLPGDEKDWFLYVARERREVRAPSGSLRLEPLIVSSRTAKTQLTDWRGWITRGRGTRTAAAGRIAFSFPEIQTIVVRPSQPTDKRALSAIVSPLVADAAGPDGRLTLNLFDSQVDVRVIATARRFPTVPKDEQFVIVDEPVWRPPWMPMLRAARHRSSSGLRCRPGPPMQ